MNRITSDAYFLRRALKRIGNYPFSALFSISFIIKLFEFFGQIAELFPFGLLFFIPLLVFLILRITLFRRYGIWCCRAGRFHGRYDAENILMCRLARGEINEEEYERLRGILKI